MRHAILIMAHHHFHQLERLCELFDDSRFELFIHIDRKSYRETGSNECLRRIKDELNNVHFVPSVDVVWGDFSQVECELILIRTAMDFERFDRIHLISGDDLPIKSLDYIDDFFLDHPDIEFLSLKERGSAHELSSEVHDRIALYWPLQKRFGRRNSVQCRLIAMLQRLLRINRLSDWNISKYGKGPNWFSVTGEFAAYVLDRSAWIYRSFQSTKCADEVFLQTIAVNSPFAERLVPMNPDDNLAALRLIDWNRGTPYTWAMADIGIISSSPAIFARKFDMVRDPDLFQAVCEMITAASNK